MLIATVRSEFSLRTASTRPPRPDCLPLRGPPRRFLPAAPGGSLPAVSAYCRPMPGALCAARLAASPRRCLLSGIGDEQPLARSPAAPSLARRPGQAASPPSRGKRRSRALFASGGGPRVLQSLHPLVRSVRAVGGVENCGKAAPAHNRTHTRKSPRGA